MTRRAKYSLLYHAIGNGVTDTGGVSFEVEALGFSSPVADGLQIGVIRWLVRSRYNDRVLDYGKRAVLEEGLGYFATTVAEAVDLFRRLSEEYADDGAKIE